MSWCLWEKTLDTNIPFNKKKLGERLNAHLIFIS